MKKSLILGLLAIFLLGVPAMALAGRIMVDNDEWTLTNTGFFAPNDPAVFAVNVANWFTGVSGTGKFHAYSTDHGYTESNLADTMSGAGYTWTTGTGITFDLPTLLTYDGIFLGGNAADNAVLIDYVNAGGNVYLAGGTGKGADFTWNTFLHHFGLSYANFYNGVSGSIAIASTHPIFAGVDSLYQNNGQDISLFGSIPGAQILVDISGHGLYAVYEPIPLPPTSLLLGSGLLGLAGWRWRVRKG
jgi:hypothetical protein